MTGRFIAATRGELLGPDLEKMHLHKNQVWFAAEPWIPKVLLMGALKTARFSEETRLATYLPARGPLLSSPIISPASLKLGMRWLWSDLCNFLCQKNEHHTSALSVPVISRSMALSSCLRQMTAFRPVD